MTRYTEDETARIAAARRELNPYADHAEPTRGHVAHICSGRSQACADGTCQFCFGGMFICSKCGGCDGATTTHCPGVQMSPERRNDVYAGLSDYRDGVWVNGPSTWTPALWLLACERAGVTP